MGRTRNQILDKIAEDCGKGVKDLIEGGRNTFNEFVQAGRSTPSTASRSGMEPLGMASTGATSATVVVAARPTRGRSEVGEFHCGIVARPPQENLSLVSKGDMTSSGDQRTAPSYVLARPPSGVMSQSQVFEVEEFLRRVPLPTRNEPTAAILARADSAKVLKHEGSMLYQGEKGDWVAGLLPQKMAENGAPSTHAGRTPTMV